MGRDRGIAMSVAVAPLIRIRPAPRLEPPADDEPPRGRPPEPLTEAPTEVWTAPAPEPPTDSQAPSAEGWLAAHRYLNLCAEVLAGFRPRVHLRPLTSPEAYN